MTSSQWLAAGALADALRSDPFYEAITVDFVDQPEMRYRTLCRYFDYAIREGARVGRCKFAPGVGAAIWRLPLSAEAEAEEKRAREAFLSGALGPLGLENYRRMVDFMGPRARAVIAPEAWYLSIIGVVPSEQGKGVGVQLLQDTLMEADRSDAECFLETFAPRSARFYERLEFKTRARHLEPVTATEYFVMSRRPKPERT